MKNRYKNNEILFLLVAHIKTIFKKNSFLEVITPPIVSNPGIEPHIHPFGVRSVVNNKNLDLYLHTSPEFFMKKLLSDGYEKIYTLSYSFRDEPKSSTHRNQFLLLEWYRANANYESIKSDTKELILSSFSFLKTLSIDLSFNETPKIYYFTVDELFIKYCNFSILKYLSVDLLHRKILKDFNGIYNDNKKLLWEDYFYLLFLNLIEPELKKYDICFVDKYPANLAALSTIKGNICQRFEVYINGLEVANCFNELTDYNVQVSRYSLDCKLKETIYKYRLPRPQVLFDSLEKGIPPSSGIALGIERLLMSLTKLDQSSFIY